MSAKQISAATMLTALPLAHVTLSAVYLWFWLVGFGAHTAALVDIRDIFSVSISQMTWVYLLAGVWPALLALLRNTAKYPSAAARLDAIPDLPARERQERADRHIRRALLIGVVFMIAAALFGLARSFLDGRPMLLSSLSVAVVLGIPVFARLRDKYGRTNLEWEIWILSLSLIVNAALFGAGQGQIDRHTRYESERGSYLHCGNVLILRRLGDHFIAVNTLSQKVITDLECNVRMVVPPHRPRRERA